MIKYMPNLRWIVAYQHSIDRWWTPWKKQRKREKMKKMFLMAAVMGLCLAAQAACSTSVAFSATGIYDGTSLVRGNTYAYYFVANELARSELCDELRNGESIGELAKMGSNLGSAQIANKYSSGVLDFSCIYYDRDALNGKDVALYFALIDTANERVYVSNEVTANWGNSATYAFGDQTTASQASTKSKFAGDAGWYSYAEIPEPTSGLLLLIGLAGIALKRKRIKA